MPDNVKSGMTIVPVSNVGEVLKVALVRQPEAIDWVETEVTSPATGFRATTTPVVTH